MAPHACPGARPLCGTCPQPLQIPPDPQRGSQRGWINWTRTQVSKNLSSAAKTSLASPTSQTNGTSKQFHDPCKPRLHQTPRPVGRHYGPRISPLRDSLKTCKHQGHTVKGPLSIISMSDLQEKGFSPIYVTSRLILTTKAKHSCDEQRAAVLGRPRGQKPSSSHTGAWLQHPAHAGCWLGVQRTPSPLRGSRTQSVCKKQHSETPMALHCLLRGPQGQAPSLDLSLCPRESSCSGHVPPTPRQTPYKCSVLQTASPLLPKIFPSGEATHTHRHVGFQRKRAPQAQEDRKNVTQGPTTRAAIHMTSPLEAECWAGCTPRSPCRILPRLYLLKPKVFVSAGSIFRD